MHPFASTYAWTQRPRGERVAAQDAPPLPPRRPGRIPAPLALAGVVLRAAARFSARTAAHVGTRAAALAAGMAQRWT